MHVFKSISLLLCCSLFLLVSISCGSQKKDAKTEAELKSEYDYRNALNQYKIGINYMNQSQKVEAVQALQNSVNLEPTNFRYRHALALAFSINGQLEEALKELEMALAINPNDSETLNLKGSVYIELGRYDEAIVCLKQVIQDKTYPQPQFAFFNLGLCMRGQQRNDEAIAAFQRVTQIEPNFFRAYTALAEIYKERRDYQTALDFFLKAEPGFNNNVDLLYEIGHAMFKLKRFDQAKAYLAQVSILFPPPNIDKPTQNMLRYIEKYQREARN